MLADVGLDAQISMTDGPTYLRLRQGRPDEAGDVSFFRWSCGCQDADGVLFPLFHSSSQWAKMGIPFTDLTGFGRFSGVDDVAIWRRADCNSLLSEPVKQQSPCL